MAVEDIIWEQLQKALDTVNTHIRKSDRLEMWLFIEEYVARAKKNEEKRL